MERQDRQAQRAAEIKAYGTETQPRSDQNRSGR
jgi:hypothetical protein